jgi:hypothetical protein
MMSRSYVALDGAIRFAKGRAFAERKICGIPDDYEDVADVAPSSVDCNVSNEGNEDPTNFPAHFREKMSLDRKFVGPPATRRGLRLKT